jgi:tetratricopeptide (TPR) repeat protein
MKPTTRATTVLLVATIAAVGCSKKDDTSQTKTAASLSTQAAVQPADAQAPKGFGEDDVVAVATKIGGPVAFADGEAAFQTKKYGDATAIFERYVAQKPKNVWGHYMLGLSAWKNGDTMKAEVAFEDALVIDPSHVKTLLNYSRLFIEQKRHDEAIELLTRAAEAEPESMVVYRLLGRTYAVKGETDKAMEAYGKAIEVNDLDAWSMNNLGLLLLDAQRFDEAVTWFTKAVDVRPSVPSFHNNLGMALEHTGRFRAAATAYREALAADPGYAKAKKNLARVEAVRTASDEEPIEIASDATPADK